jgi:hypothetical protein
MCLKILRMVNVACLICGVHQGNWKGLSNELCMCGREYLCCYRRFGEWCSESIIGLYGTKLLNCSVPHCSLSNFQGEKCEKVKSNGVGVLLLSNHIHDQLAPERRSKVIYNPSRSRILCCNVRVCKVEGLMIQVCSRLFTHLE